MWFEGKKSEHVLRVRLLCMYMNENHKNYQQTKYSVLYLQNTFLQPCNSLKLRDVSVSGKSCPEHKAFNSMAATWLHTASDSSHYLAALQTSENVYL